MLYMLRQYNISIGEKIMPYFHYIILIIFVFVIYNIFRFKYKNKYWLNQVIYNKYDPRLWGKKGFIVNNAKLTKYFDSNIYSCKWDDLDYTKKCALSWFLNKHYTYYKDLVTKINTKKLESLFTKHNKKCFISLFYETPKKNSKLLGSIVSKPLEGRLYNKDLKLYTFDYICGIDKLSYFKTLYTHFKRHRETVNDKIFVFSTSEKIEISTSLISINTFLYSIKFFPRKVVNSYNGVKIILLNSSNYRLFMNTFYKLYEVFDCFLHVHLSQLLYLCDQKIINICVYLVNNKLLCCYFFKNNHSLHNNSHTITLVGSYQGDASQEIFLEGFYNAIVYISNSIKIKSLLIDDLGQNSIFIEEVKKYKLLQMYTSYIYFYNFIYNSFKKDQVLLLY